jgi:hypothetical protein
MPTGVESPLTETVREGDIYRQYAMTLLSVNEFFYDKTDAGMKFSLGEAQKQLSILGGIANNYLLKRVGDDDDDRTKNDRCEVKILIDRQEKFITIKTDKALEYDPIKTDAMSIIKEYDRLLLKHGVCK